MNMLFPESQLSRRRAMATLVAGVGAVLAQSWSVLAASAKAGDTFPDLSQFGLEGALPDLKGKVALVDFWASWCAPCKKSFPVMKDLVDKFGSRGFTVIAVNLDEKKAAMESFLKKNPIPFVVLHDAKGRLAEAIGVEKIPTSFLVDPNGKITRVHSGFDGEATRREYLAEIEAALKGAGQ
jgi:thiol-disulfide isomerase/thioredoxin